MMFSAPVGRDLSVRKVYDDDCSVLGVVGTIGAFISANVLDYDDYVNHPLSNWIFIPYQTRFERCIGNTLADVLGGVVNDTQG